jgi:hypothetical protein
MPIMTPAASGYDYNPSWSATRQRRHQQHTASGSNRLAPVVRAATGVGGAHGQPTRMSQPQPLPPPRESSNDSTATTSGEKKKRVGEQAFDPAPSASAMLRHLSAEFQQPQPPPPRETGQQAEPARPGPQPVPQPEAPRLRKTTSWTALTRAQDEQLDKESSGQRERALHPGNDTDLTRQRSKRERDRAAHARHEEKRSLRSSNELDIALREVQEQIVLASPHGSAATVGVAALELHDATGRSPAECAQALEICDGDIHSASMLLLSDAFAHGGGGSGGGDSDGDSDGDLPFGAEPEPEPDFEWDTADARSSIAGLFGASYRSSAAPFAPSTFPASADPNCEPPPRSDSGSESSSSSDSAATTSDEEERFGEQEFDPAPSASAMLRQLSLEMRQQTRQAEEEVDLHERSSDKLRRELEVREMIMSALCSAL